MVSEALVDRLIESGRVPDPILRAGIRAVCAARLRQQRRAGPAAQLAFVDTLRKSVVAEQVDKANEQHYEVPPAFFELVLGPRLKYSSCYWPPGVASLSQAEDAMLALSCDRAQIEDGMTLLDLGCGWGSLTGWLAERYPSSRVVAVSNSHQQRAFIESKRLANVHVVTADANTLDLAMRFDRIVSVEMLEHMRNYELLFSRIASWLEPDGKLFCHVFSHDRFAYAYDAGWMARTFFSGGTMPSHELLPQFQRELVLEEDWRVPGTHYARTAEEWIIRLDANRAAIDRVIGRAQATNWRVFFLACAELWGYRGGREWLVSHYRFRRRSTAAA